ncbi:MAG: hypothetical protein ACREF3_16800 [Acetobacteraceae bacterium]
MNSLPSFTTTQDRLLSKPRRNFVGSGNSIASSDELGGVCVTGSTITRVRLPSSAVASTMAHGRSFTPSS